jgi:hypothetical protein
MTEITVRAPSPEIDPLLAQLQAHPAEMVARFFEVYFGPAKPTTV